MSLSKFPYDTSLNGSEMLSKIKEMAAYSVKSGHISVDWPDYLGIYLELKYELSEPDRLWFGELIYNIAVSGDDIAISEFYLFLVTVLLKYCVFNRRESKVSSDCSLILDWRPIYEMITKCAEDKLANTNMAYSVLPSYLDCLKVVQRYFDPMETENILEEFIPKLNPMLPGSCINQFSLLAQFLPTNRVPPQQNFYWVPLIFDIWQNIAWSVEFSTQCCELFAVLAMDQRYNPERVPWTDNIIRKVFAHVLDCLEFVDGAIGEPQDSSKLPTLFNREYSTTASGQLTYKSQNWSPARVSISTIGAQLIVFTLYPQTAKLGLPTLNCLLDLIDIVEPFCHPSANGPWTLKILDLLSEICRNLVIRKKKETGTGTKAPQHLKLTSEIYDSIASKLIPLAQLTIFGEDDYEVDQSQKILNYLSLLCPGLVFEKLLPSIFNSLETLVAPQRTRSALALLATSVKSFVRGDMARYLPKLMLLALPGIDLNDEIKSSLTIAFYTTIGLFIPIATCNGSQMEIDNYDETLDIASATKQFPEWIELFTENLFVCIRNLPERTVTNGSNPLTNIIGTMCQVLFSGLSADLETILLGILKEHMSHVLPFAIDTTAVIYGSFAQRNPKKRLDAFLPICCQKIKDDVGCGLGSQMGSSDGLPFGMASLSDAGLHWYQAILVSICSSSGESLLSYEPQLLEITNLMVMNCNSRVGSRLTFQLIFYVLEALIQLYPRTNSTHDLKMWNDSTFVQNIDSHWSDKTTPDNFDADWHIPSQSEINFGLKMLGFYIDVVIEKLGDLMNQGTLDGTKNSRYAMFQKWVDLMSVLIVASQYVLNPKHHPPKNDYLSNSGPFSTIKVETYYVFNDPITKEYQTWESKLSNLYQTLLQAVDYFMAGKCEDPATISLLIFCTTSSIGYRFGIDNLQNFISDFKPMVSSKLDKWTTPRAIRVRQNYLLHHKRLSFSRQFSGISDIDSKLMDSLLGFCVSRYKTVRRMAIKSLHSIMQDTRLFFEYVFKSFTKMLNDQKSEDFQLEGVFETLIGINEEMMLLLRTHWEYYFELSKCLFLLLSTRKMDHKLSKLTDEFQTMLLNNLPIALNPLNYSKRALELVESINLNEMECKLLNANATRNRAQYKVALSEYRQFLLNLVQNNNYHWKIGSMVANVIGTLVYNLDPISPELIQFSLQGLNNDNDQVKASCMPLFYQIAHVMKKRAKSQNKCYSRNLKLKISSSDSDYPNVIANITRRTVGSRSFSLILGSVSTIQKSVTFVFHQKFPTTKIEWLV